MKETNIEWIDMETRECHCYNCCLFKNNKCSNRDICVRPTQTYKGFFREV